MGACVSSNIHQSFPVELSMRNPKMRINELLERAHKELSTRMNRKMNKLILIV